MNNKAIAHNLKRLRSNARYNQSDLAEKAGMSQWLPKARARKGDS